MKIALSIAGHDPTSGAGITADLAVFAAHGLFGTSCITALTVQSTRSVRETHPIPAQLLTQTLECLTSDVPPDGIKIGMLATAPIVAAVADFLTLLRTQYPSVPVVLDPVLRSSSGSELLTREGLTLLRRDLLPLIDWVTPNIDELALLSERGVDTAEDVLNASKVLLQSYPGLNILATGGHLNPPDDLLLTADGEFHWLPGKHIETTSTHGTGCALSSALLANLVRRMSPIEAGCRAKAYVASSIQSATPIGRGKGPLNLSAAINIPHYPCS